MVSLGKQQVFFLKQYVNLRNVLIAAVLFLLYLMFSNLAKALIFTIIFVPVGIFSIKLSRLMPNINLELVTPFSFFMGYFFGWPVGLFFGVILGMYMWSTAYSLSHFVMLNIFLNGLLGFMGSYFHSTLMWQFSSAYLTSMLIRNVLAYVLAIPLGANPVENAMHVGSDAIVNMLIFAQIIFMIAKIPTII